MERPELLHCPNTATCTDIVIGGAGGAVDLEQQRLDAWNDWKAGCHDICPDWLLKRLALSPREEQVVLGVLNELEDKEIAAKLSIAACTVRQHFNNAYLKLMPERAVRPRDGGAKDKDRTRSGLILFVWREGLKKE